MDIEDQIEYIKELLRGKPRDVSGNTVAVFLDGLAEALAATDKVSGGVSSSDVLERLKERVALVESQLAPLVNASELLDIHEKFRQGVENYRLS